MLPEILKESRELRQRARRLEAQVERLKGQVKQQAAVIKNRDKHHKTLKLRVKARQPAT
jgi:hypothetical protein